MTVLKLPKTAAAVSLIIFLILPSISAQGPRGTSEPSPAVGYGAEADFNSNYVWRGIVLDNRPVMQPSAWISVFGFNFAAWGDVPLTNTPERTHLHATGLSLSYTRDWNKL